MLGALTLYVFVLVEDNRQHNFVLSNITWDKYLTECGYKAYTKNPRATKVNFNRKFF